MCSVKLFRRINFYVLRKNVKVNALTLCCRLMRILRLLSDPAFVADFRVCSVRVGAAVRPQGAECEVIAARESPDVCVNADAFIRMGCSGGFLKNLPFHFACSRQSCPKHAFFSVRSPAVCRFFDEFRLHVLSSAFNFDF